MSQLRSFKFYTNVAPVMISPPLLTSTPNGTISGNLADLNVTAAAAGFFQLFDQLAAPTTTVTVPLKSFQILAAGTLSPWLFPELGPIRFVNGLWAAMSSTEAVYTAVATNFDVFGEYEEWEYPRDGVTTRGPSGAQSTYQIWSEATGPKMLKRLTVTELGGQQSYILIYAVDNPGANAVPDYPPIPIAANATKDLYFQLTPFRKDTSIVGATPGGVTINDFATHTGCSVAISTDPTKFVGGAANFYAEYYNSGVYP